jgi:predicted glycosyltransferase involved in capsule biosynthesis
MTKIDLKDLSFLIPIRLDSMDRMKNILLVLEFIKSNFNTNITILEADKENKLQQYIPKDINYIFIEDSDPIFHRTFYINQMVKQCTTDYVAIWDSDVICNPQQIIDGINLLRNNEADFIYPYKDMFLDISKPILNLYAKTGDISILYRYSKRMKEMYSPNPVGGAFIANKQSYIESGLEDESFYGWGLEDGERWYRWTNSGYKIKRIEGALYHLTHDRGINSTFHSIEAKVQKEIKRDNIALMTKDEI